MAIDFVHTAELVDAVIAVLEGSGATHIGGLPTAWFTSGDDEELKILEHGDYTDYAKAGVDVMDELPAILVRGLGPAPTGKAGTGGVLDTDELIRVIHIRRFTQCYDGSGDEQLNMTEARERYVKVISKALFNDPNRKLAVIDGGGSRTEVSLTSTDGNVQVVQALWTGWDMGHAIDNPHSIEDVAMIRMMELPLWAIGCDLTVKVRTGGES